MSFFNLKDTINERYQDYAIANGSDELAKELITWSKQQGFSLASNDWYEFVDSMLGIRICFKIKSFLLSFTIQQLDHTSDTWTEFMNTESLTYNQQVIKEETIDMFMSLIKEAIDECPINL